MKKSIISNLIVGLFLASATVTAMAEVNTPTTNVYGATAGATINSNASVNTNATTMSYSEVRAEYKSARAECNKMTGADRRSCLRDAKAARNSHMHDGVSGSTSSSVNSGGTVGGMGSGAMGTTTPGAARGMGTQPTTSPTSNPSDGSGNTVPSTNSH